MIGRKRLIVAAGAIALVASGCSGTPRVAVGTLTPESGIVEVLRDEGWEAVTEATELAPGDQVRSGDAGVALLQLAPQGRIEMAPLSRVRLGTAGAAELMVGSVLAEGSGLSIEVGRAHISPESSGVFRVDRDFSTRVGSYRSNTVITALGRTVVVRQLRQVVVLAHVEPSADGPLIVAANDPWDLRMLGAAMDLGRTVSELEHGVRTQVARQPQPAAAIAQAIPGPLSEASVSTLLRNHASVRPSKVFVSLALASVAPEVPGVLPAARSILSNLEQGAQWVVVVAGLQLTEQPDVVDQLGGVLASLAPSVVGPDPAESPSPTGTPPDDDGDPTTPPPTCTTDCPTEPPPEEPCAPDDTGCQAQQAIEDILGGLQGNGDRDGDLLPF